MPRYMDVHRNMEGATAEELARAHQKDVEIQDKHDVKFVRYWYDTDKGAVFCLSEAPNPDAALAVHQEAGHPTEEIYQVEEGA